ncbi:vWA domain-containing protein [Candidatus Thiodiazotropha sp. CDECU1]|uniref:vWA domain-containing protein n=1 Tax=Candidatus Thiodiazotropha sp. CDECU1 TaxID=3065865 RepID=UPI002931B98F|nr:VWA domain-containing protein [Candidatus Thiodiazotropha sp. CDECU1]
MKSKIIAAALFTFTAGGIAFYPALKDVGAVNMPLPDPVQVPAVHTINQEQPKIEVVFALDTTGSMGGLIEASKEKIWSIASTMAQAQPAPEIRMGLVAYRDRGDSYVTQVVDLSEDLDSVYATLMDFRAEGGGDGPESVNQALHDAVNKISWSQDEDAYRVVFLVGDAPPHMDYQDDVKYPQTLKLANARGIVVNTIQAGNRAQTRLVWSKIALAGLGQYAQVSQDGNAVAIHTPFDENLAKLSRKLDATRLYYGSEEVLEKKRQKLKAADKLHESASVASRARRATFNATKSGKSNLLGDSELVDDVASGRVELDSIDRDHLPASIKAMAPQEQRAVISEKAQQRQALQKEIDTLSAQRKEYLEQEVKKSGGAKGSLDHKLYSAIREQAERSGIHYEAEALTY